MKLIIDIPEEEYKRSKLAYNYDSRRMDNYSRIIGNGTPLDDVKAEIAEEICLTDNPYTKETKYTIEHLKLLEILDNIGKAEKEGGRT